MKLKEVEGFSCVGYARYIVPNFASNSVFIGAKDSNVTVISPGKSLLDGFAELHPHLDQDAGKKLTIVMPNSYHYMGVKSWLERYSNATLKATAQAVNSLRAKGFDSVDIQVLQDGDEGPVEGSTWLVPPGHRGGDVWLVVKNEDQCLWVTCDSFLNYPRMSNQPIARLTQRLMGAAPGLKLSKVIKYVLLTDRVSFKQWCLEVVALHAPTTLLPSHGEVLEGESVAQEIRALVESRL